MRVTPCATSSAIAAEMRLNAAAFIVTIYGDVVVPRGGVLWTGTLIELCAGVGINESLVRTAVSRLVGASQLVGARLGRRSYYRLERSAVAAFLEAAEILYGPDRPASGWQIIHDPSLKPEDARRRRMGQIDGTVFIRPDRGQPIPAGAVAFRAEAVLSAAPLAGYWDLSALNDGYARFLQLFGPVEKVVARGVADAEALILRLLLVHAYRMVLLRDPRLNPEHLRSDWNGAEARGLFRSLYLALTPAAHRHISAHCEGSEGLFPAETESTSVRLEGLTSRK
ncbi:MAG: PaaX family transcriptional regulator C-terminal domain-containing protein [Paracoccaceae bacterium]